jgi:hypothetical protein
MFSNFTYKDSDGRIRQIPVLYGDLTRQVANIIKENSENKLPSVPRMSIYMTGLEMDRSRTSDSSFVSKVHIRERAFDENNNEYLNTQGKNYTVERLMPTPYKLSVTLDLWTSNTDQKLQIIEQILTLFNPSLEIQTTDNFIDWTSISVVDLEQVDLSNRSIPVGTESEIDIASLRFSTPIFISPPAKVKRLGVITNIITSIFNESTGSIQLGEGLFSDTSFTITESRELTDANGNKERIVDYGQFPNDGTGEMDINVTRRLVSNATGSSMFNTTWLNLGIYIIGNIATIVDKGTIGQFSWRDYFEVLPGCYKPGITELRLILPDGTTVIGYVTINPLNPNELTIIWDPDTLPANTIIEGPGRDPNSWSSIDYIIDPLRWNPNQAKTVGLRLMLLGKIGNDENNDGADGWKNNDGSDFVAGESDLVEWDGERWHVVFSAENNKNNVIYISNLFTGTQYRWTGEYWTKSFEGEYPAGAWEVNG